MADAKTPSKNWLGCFSGDFLKAFGLAILDLLGIIFCFFLGFLSKNFVTFERKKAATPQRCWTSAPLLEEKALHRHGKPKVEKLSHFKLSHFIGKVGNIKKWKSRLELHLFFVNFKPLRVLLHLLRRCECFGVVLGGFRPLLRRYQGTLRDVLSTSLKVHPKSC